MPFGVVALTPLVGIVVFTTQYKPREGDVAVINVVQGFEARRQCVPGHQHLEAGKHNVRYPATER